MHQHELPSTLLTCRSAEKSSDEMKCGVWRVQCEVWGVKSAVWSVECEVWSVECEVWSVDCEGCSVKCEECGVWSAKSAVWRVQCEVRSVECEAWSVKWSFKCDMWNTTSVSQSARTHGLGWRTAHASSIDEKGLIYIFKATSAPPRAGTTGNNNLDFIGTILEQLNYYGWLVINGKLTGKQWGYSENIMGI